LDEDEGTRAFSKKPVPPTSQFAPLQRRHSFHTLTDEEPTLLHDLRSYFDPQYRLYLVKKQLLSLVRDDDVSVEEMFDLVDEDFSGVLERDELCKMIHMLQIKVKEVEIDTLMDILDEDGSGGVDIDEFQDWLFATEDQWLERRRTRDDDEFNDQRLLQRDILRFDADIRGMLGALWDLVDADDSGQVDVDEYVTLSVNLQRAVTDDFDLDEAKKIAKREFEFDAQGHETMDRTLFFWSFFQLADAWRDGPAINSGSYCYFMDFLSDRCTSIEVVEGKPTLVWKWSSDPEWYSKIEPMRLVEKRRNARRKKGLPPEPIPSSPLREMALYNRQQQYPDAVEAPAPSKKLTLKEAAKAAKNAVKARKNQQRRKARRSWDLEQEEKARLQARNDADASYLEAERLRLEMEAARSEALRAKQEKQREALRSKAEAKALRELEKREAAAKREAARLEKLGEKQKAADLREQARREAQQEQARLKREAAAAREFSLKKKLEDKLRAKAASADRKRRLMEGKVEEAERRRLMDIEQKAAAAKARRRSCIGAPAPAPFVEDDEYDYRKMLGSIARESYDDFSYASTQPSPPKDRKKKSFASPPKDATESEAPLPDWDAASYAASHRSDGPPSARSFARSFRSDGSEVKQQDPDFDERSVSKSYRSDGTEIKEGDEDYDDPSAVASVRSYRADGTELRPGDADWDDLSHVSFARSVTSVDELSVQSYRSDGSPLKVPSPGKSDALIKDFLSSPSKSDISSHKAQYQEAASPVQSDLSSPAKDDLSYRSDGSLIKPTDPDSATDGLRYREDGSQKLPEDDDYNIPPSYRSDRTLIKRGDPDYIAGTFDRRKRLAEQAAEELRIKEQEALQRREEREQAAAARRLARAAEADQRRIQREAAALARKQQREAEAAKKIEAARLKGDLKAIDRISEALSLKNRREAEELARVNKSELAALERANQVSRQKLRAQQLEDEQKLRAEAAELRRQLREAAAIEEIHESWVVGDEMRAESIAEGLVKANRASLMGLERAEADAAADLARRDRASLEAFSEASGRTYRTDGSLIRETDPDFLTDGKAYRADGTVKHPGDADYVTLPNFRSDGTEVRRGDPDYYSGGRRAGPLSPVSYDSMSSPAKSPQRSDGSYVKPGDSDYDEWSFVSKLTNPEEASFTTASCVGGGPVGAEDMVSYRSGDTKTLEYVPSSPGDHSSVTPFPREKTPQDLANEAHDGDFDHLTHESSLSPLDRQGPRDAGWFPPGGHGSYIARGLVLNHSPQYFKEKMAQRKPPTPPEKHTDFGLRYCYPPSNSVEVSDGVCCSPRKPSEDYFVLDPGKQSTFELPAPPVTKEQPRCPIWSFGDTPWFSKVLDEQTMALTDGALDVGGARAMRLISKQRLARKLGAPQRRRNKRRHFGIKPPRWGPGDDEPFVPGGVAIRDKRDARYTRLFSGEPPPLEEPSPRESLERLSSFIETFRREDEPNDVWAKISKGGVKPMTISRRRSLDSIGVGRTVPRGQEPDEPRLIMRGMR